MAHFDNRSGSNCDKVKREKMITDIEVLQNTLNDMLEKIDTVKKENRRIRIDNQVLIHFIEKLYKVKIQHK